MTLPDTDIKMITRREPWDDRPPGEFLTVASHLPTVAKLSNGRFSRGFLSSQQAFAALWDERGEALAKDWLACSKRPKTLVSQDACKLLTFDFGAKHSRLLSFNQGFLSCAEDDLLAGVGREGWIRAWTAGRRRVNSLAMASCLPPEDWTFELVNPREVGTLAAGLIAHLRSGRVEIRDLRAWGREVCKYRTLQQESLAEVAALLESAEFFAEIERLALVDHVPCLAPAGSAPQRRL